MQDSAVSFKIAKIALLGCCLILISSFSWGQGRGTYTHQDAGLGFTEAHYQIGDNSLDERPVSLAAHDLDGDGNLDLITVNSGASIDGHHTISVLLGDGNGRFSSSVEFPIDSDPIDTAEPQAIVAADFDEDGISDVAITGNAGVNGRVTILLGSAGGVFGRRQHFSVGSGAKGLTAADLNWDGHVDLAVVNRESKSVSVLFGLGDGTFRRVVPDLDTAPCQIEDRLLDCGDPNSIVADDFNRDGFPDLAISSGTGNTISIFIGMGDGQFGAKHDIGAGGEPLIVFSNDYNDDSIIDLAVVNHLPPEVSLFIGNGDGTFKPKMNIPIGANGSDGDLDRDGGPGVLAANGLTPSILFLLFKDTDSVYGGLAGLGSVPFRRDACRLVVGDFNHDTRLDIAMTDVDGVTVLLNEKFNVHDLAIVRNLEKKFEMDRQEPKADSQKVGILALPEAQAQGGPHFTQCSPTGHTCNFLITMNRNGQLQVDTDLSTQYYPPDSIRGSLIGFKNSSNERIYSLSLNVAPGTPYEMSDMCQPAQAPISYNDPNVSIITLDAATNLDIPPYYFHSACVGTACPNPRNTKCDVVFSGGIPKGGSTYFSISSSPTYSGYWQVMHNSVIPWISFQNVIAKDQIANATLTLYPPNPASVTLNLTTLTGTGSAVFVDTGSTTMTINTAGPVQIPIRGVDPSSVWPNIQLSATVNGIRRDLNFTIIKIDSVNVHSSDADTHKIAAVSGATHDDHFVCAKDTGDIVLNANVLPGDWPTDQLVWEADGASITYNGKAVQLFLGQNTC